MPGKVLLTAAAAFMLAGAGIPASDMYLGRVAGSADAVPSALTLEPAKPSVSVRVSNTSGKPGVVRGKLGDKVATAVVPGHSSIVTLTWEEPVATDDVSGVLRLELYPDGESNTPTDVEEHPVALGAGGYHQPSKTPGPKPSDSKSPWPKPSHSMSETPKPSHSMSESPKPSDSGKATPSKSAGGGGELPQTGSGTSDLVVLGGGSLLFGSFVLGLAWVMRRRFLRDNLS